MSISLSADARRFASQSPAISVCRDLVYAPERKSLNRLDVYSPRSGNLHPVLIFLHGGKFSFGDKISSAFDKPAAFTSRGFVFVSVDYRLSPAVKYPTHVQDVAESVSWVHKNIQRYGGDPNRLFVMGHSAGAQLAGLVATDEQFLAKHGLDLSCIKGAILLDGGTYNLAATAKSSSRHDLLISVFGKDPSIWWQASPIKHIGKSKNIPPFLIVYVPNRVDAAAQSLAFHNALRSAGIHSTLISTKGKTHATLNEDIGLPRDKPTEAIFEFLGKTYRN
ncbi:MAG: alpha/beta hydrolase [Cyanobacteria bacterium SZAS-4]|nr:alpha/beta hydrolase [Cyanobacteria bacterium SZAS-4]